MEPTSSIQPLIQTPLFNPTYLNIEYVFAKILQYIQPIINVLANPQTWTVVGIVSALISILCIGIIIFSLVRLREIQIYDKREVDHEIHEALLRDQETSRNENPRWHYVLTLVESPNESDWRVAIIEADNMLEELFKERGFHGDTLSELLEDAKSGGILSIQNAWDAHLVRNKIAHEGSNFALSQVEARRVIKMFQNVFEELRAI
ncbi:MAG TPA: hypothetical protein VMR49_01315 [Candidatus Paceibacterota bacterium]|nr:hypothetical protein [Candidatus Paceibacterota bacterium]